MEYFLQQFGHGEFWVLGRQDGDTSDFWCDGAWGGLDRATCIPDLSEAEQALTTLLVSDYVVRPWVGGEFRRSRPIDVDAYAEFVTSMASKDSLADFKSKLGTAGLGLAGESGEIGDTCKKLMYHGMPWTEEVRQQLIKETGDVAWYLAFFCKNVLGVSLNEVLDRNVQKLKARYKSGSFSTEEFLAKERAKSVTS